MALSFSTGFNLLLLKATSGYRSSGLERVIEPFGLPKEACYCSNIVALGSDEVDGALPFILIFYLWIYIDVLLKCSEGVCGS